ncbi:MAG: hypothetical protein ACUVS4_15960 [Chloroflexaceae bacterium]
MNSLPLVSDVELVVPKVAIAVWAAETDIGVGIALERTDVIVTKEEAPRPSFVVVVLELDQQGVCG